MMAEKNVQVFNKLDLSKYAGLCLGIVDGKIIYKEKNTEYVMKRLLNQPPNKEISLICVPSKKTTMAI